MILQNQIILVSRISYRENVQNAEQTVDALPSINFLNTELFAILQS